MTTVKKIESGQYAVSDGRFIIKRGSSWFVLSNEGKTDFGPLPTLTSAKEYVTTGLTTLGNHNLGSTHGRKQSRRESNAYMASEAKNGNLGPLFIYILLMVAVCIFFLVIRGY